MLRRPANTRDHAISNRRTCHSLSRDTTRVTGTHPWRRRDVACVPSVAADPLVQPHSAWRRLSDIDDIMDIIKANTDGGHLPYTHVAQQQQNAQGAMLRMALIGAIALLLTVNLTYFVKTNARIDALAASTAGAGSAEHTHSLPGGSTAGAVRLAAGSTAGSSQLDGGGASEAAQQAAVSYLVDEVLTSRPARQPLKDVLLPTLAATNISVKEYRSKVASYLDSSAFKQRWDALRQQSGNERGIVISAGGKYYLPQAVVLLRVLRHHLHSKLPVQLFWHGDEEMDATTLAALREEFAPLEGVDATKVRPAGHHLPGATLKGFPLKPYALLHSRFKEALLLDCDVVLMRDPAYLFDAPEYRASGNLLWGDIYGEGMFQDKAFDYIGLDRRVKRELDAGKADFKRYTESGQVLINRAMHLDALEWTWFVNSFSKGHMYEFMYGDKDTYGLGFALAGKAHMYTHVNMPPAGIFTHLNALGWQPGKAQMNKQGNWWLHALGHYDHLGELLLMHRVTGEVSLSRPTPKDEVITPPIPYAWSMWYMGYGPGDRLQTTLQVAPLNVSYFLQTAAPGQLCPLAAWSAYWTLRTHGIPTHRNLTLEGLCSGMLDAQYGAAAASIIRSRLMEHPLRLVINKHWESKVDGGWKAPKAPLLAVPLNMTAAYSMWQNMDAALTWARQWAHDKPTLAQLHRSLLLL